MYSKASGQYKRLWKSSKGLAKIVPPPTKISDVPTPSQLLARAARIGEEIAGPAASDVDNNARFPSEAIAALKSEQLLSAGIPVEWGGYSASVTALASLCEILAQHCSSTAMIFAMHQIQVASIVRHAEGSDFFADYLHGLVQNQWLIASVTSEVGVGGDMRTSRACVETIGDRFVLNKEATTISYGAQADDLLVTARRTPDSAPNDQSLILVRKADCTLEQTGEWDTLGMRGTCSPSFSLRAQGKSDQILPVAFADIATQTMVPYSHLVWASCWAGIARGAVGKARRFVRGEARKKPGTVPPQALRLAETVNLLQTMQHSISASCSAYEVLSSSTLDTHDVLSSIGWAIQMNNLKLSTSQQVRQIVSQSLDICGIAGYKNNGPFALGRQLRDAHSAALMIANERILATNAALLLIHKDS